MITPTRCGVCNHLSSDAARTDGPEYAVWFVCVFNPEHERGLIAENIREGPPPAWCPLSEKPRRYAKKS